MAEVVIYTKPGCPYCAGAKADFQKKGVAFREVRVPGNAAALDEMLKVNGGQRRVPTMVVDGKVIVGFEGGG